MPELVSAGTPQVQLTDGTDIATILAASDTLEETTAQYLAGLTALYAFDGTTLARLLSEVPADALADGGEHLRVVTEALLFNGTSWDRQRSGGSAAPLLGVPLQAEVWNPVLQRDITANDPDKTFTVPANRQWKINWINLYFQASANAGTRAIRVDIRDGSDNALLILSPAISQIATEERAYRYFPGNPRETAFNNSEIYLPLPNNLILPAGYDVRAFDSATIHASDTIQFTMLVEERTV